MSNTLPGLIAAMFGALLVAIGLPGQWLAHAMPSAHAESRMLEARVPQSGAGADAGAGAGAGGLGQPGHREPLASDLAILMSQASQYQPVQVRQPAQARLQSIPHLAQALAAALQGPQRDQALTYLESNDPIDAPALAEPVRAAILGMATGLRDEIRRAHSLRGDHFVPQVRRILAAADKFEPYGVDYLPAVRAVRDALAEPHPNGGDLRCRQVLDRWLAKHARTGARQAQRLAPGLA
ncbi:MAG: hypothetical protein KAY46_17005 [Burkholderiaceae bacterium]|nr:hypothetical protein [Burkholderiaceae bacterium]